MTQPRLRYELHSAGWATAVFNDGKEFTMNVSYLHDSLRDLARSVLDLEAGRPGRVLFMDEPGETLLELDADGGELHYSLKSFHDWASWGLTKPDNFKLLARGSMRQSHYRSQVETILTRIHDEIGIEKYRELWVEHDFPLDEFEVLRRSGQRVG